MSMKSGVCFSFKECSWSKDRYASFFVINVIAEEHKHDSKLEYFMRCRKEGEIVLPILQKIKKKTLNLTGYTISSTLARILGGTFTKSDRILSRLILDSNNL